MGVAHRHARAGRMRDDPWPCASGSSNPTQLVPLRAMGSMHGPSPLVGKPNYPKAGLPAWPMNETHRTFNNT